MIWEIHSFLLNKCHANVYFIGDLHLGQEAFAKAAFKEVISRIEGDSSAVVILMGDLIELATKKAYQSGEVIPRKHQLRILKEYLEPIKSKIVCVLSGNHEQRITKEVGVDYLEDALMPFLPNAVYLGYEGWFDLKLKGSSTLMYLHHGAGGSINPEFWIKKLLFNTGIGGTADVISSGHCHSQWHKVYTVPVRRGKKIVRKSVLGIRTGSYLGMATYAKIAGYGVTSIGGVLLSLRVNDKYSVEREVVYL